MMCSLEDGEEVEVFVRHLVDEAIMGPMLIEYGSHVDIGESCAAFNARPSESENFNFGVGEDHLNSEAQLLLFKPHILSLPHLLSILLLQIVPMQMVLLQMVLLMMK